MAAARQAPREAMPEQDPAARAGNFLEVPQGYTEEQAVQEASRCLQCKQPACVRGCPVGVDIPGFVGLLARGRFDTAIERIWERNSLPAVCGRVCPQESQCEGQCVLGRKGQPVAIGNLERFAADWERAHNACGTPARAAHTGRRVAVVGSGPSSLTVAGDLVRKGHDVTLFEAFHKPGGVLVYGIPEFRLPKAIVAAEVACMQAQGVRLECDVVVGRTLTVDELFGMGFDAVYLGVGAGLPRFMDIPGESLNGVLSANEYLTRANLMRAYLFPKVDTPIPRGRKVAVLGGGNVAMDCARTAVRLGAERVTLVYRRSRDEMPARGAEIHHAEEEGVRFELLASPVRYLGDAQGTLAGLECQRMELGEPDATGRRRPVPVEGSAFTVECDLAIVAIGSGANPLLPRATPDLPLDRRGYILAHDHTGKTGKRGVWAGGDIVTGAATVILAMGAGRKAADSIHDYLVCGW
ncbi:MAG: NADPH-dependent glutamate synthase [Desulfovibrio sp.]|jgi:glutamate synthase (NADPH/NADH) small chain|nr:NADPH-dependent glutamate synthase [Desulfovibrio sp.]